MHLRARRRCWKNLVFGCLELADSYALTAAGLAET
jgi:hypothetical protein